MTHPLYLVEPTQAGHLYGRVVRVDGHYEIHDAEPAVREAARRVLPGCTGGREGPLRFKANRRMVGELNWLLLRYPMTIEAREYEADRQAAINHATRRERNHTLEPVTPPPTFKGTLYPYQGEAVPFLLQNQRALLADDMGLGKTVSALAALAAGDLFPALVVAPTSVQRQWPRMAATFLQLPDTGPAADLFEPCGNHVAHIMRGLTPYCLPRRPLYVTHYGLLRTWQRALAGFGFKAIIFDEIQELRHATTAKYSAASLLAGEATHVWGLSGTPIHNYGAEMWSILNILDFQCLGDFESFTREWCVGYGQKVVAQPEILRDHLRREGLMLRRRKEEVQSQLPPKRRVVTVIDKDDDVYRRLIFNAVQAARRYDQITDWHERGMATREIDQASRRATGVSKAPFVAQFAQSLIDAGERPLIYSWHHEVHDILAARLAPHRPVMITGRQTQRERELAMQAFIDGKADVVLLSLRTSAGLDGLQGRATCVVFAELDWSPAIHAQCESRLCRIGVAERESILCYYLVSDTGYDEVIQEALGLKIGQFIGLMGDKAETESDRMLAQLDAAKHLGKVIDRLKAMESIK